MVAPFGMTSGFASVALTYLATTHGLSVVDGAVLASLAVAPHAWKFLWSPVVDTTLDRTRWYVLANFAVAASLAAQALVPLGPDTLRAVQVAVLVASVASTFLGMAVEGLVAHLADPAERGRVGGWFQAGNLGGSGLGGGLALWLLTVAPPWLAGLGLAAAVLACNAALIGLPRVAADAEAEGAGGRLRAVLRSVREVGTSREGLACAVLCFVPLGTGTAGVVLNQAEVATAWGISADDVAFWSGGVAGVVSMAGSLAGGWLCTRLDARWVYVAAGALLSAVALAVSVVPEGPTAWIASSMIYTAVTGVCFASFTGFVLATIGQEAAATKYSLYASLANVPITYMGVVNGRAAEAWGTDGMLYADAAAGLLGIVVFAATFAVLGGRPASPAA